MTRTWLSLTVELLGGRGTELWPWPGRSFVVGPSHTFADLADAVNDAFARWDRAHLSMFTLADGRVVTDKESGYELAESIRGPIRAPMDIAVTRVARTVELGAEFQFVFDLGDQWIHRCAVETEKVDPVEVLGIRPAGPRPYWGWGSIPDQYGRRWRDDDGEGRAPARPNRPHPMLLGSWPGQQQISPIDMSELRRAVAGKDATRYVSAVLGHDVDDVLQQVGCGIPMALEQVRPAVEPIAMAIINRLALRAAVGDDALAEDIVACLRREPLPGRAAPVDLELLSSELEGGFDMSTEGYLDLSTGEVWGGDLEDSPILSDGEPIDPEDDPDRWLRLDRIGSRAGWQDMADFAERQRDQAVRERLERALHGSGAFRRFRDLVHDEDLAEQWSAFATDRQLGRARQWLADNGIRVGRAGGGAR